MLYNNTNTANWTKDKMLINYDEIADFYEGAIQLLNCFIENYKCYIEPFQDNKHHQIQNGTIKWDIDRNEWIGI